MELAESILRNEIFNHPKCSLLRTCLGSVLCDQAKYEEAKTHFELAVALNSTDRNTFLNLGVVLLNYATHEEAMVMFNKAKTLESHSDSWEVYFDPMAQ